MFTRAFATACFIVSAYYIFIPTFALAPLHYSPRVKHWTEIADTYSDLYGKNRCIMRAVIKVESNGCKHMLSKAGARGCAQLMPATARALGLRVSASVDERSIPEDNIAVGTKHLFELIDAHGLIKGLKIYNAGPKRVDKTPENRAYAAKVLNEIYKCKS